MNKMIVSTVCVAVFAGIAQAQVLTETWDDPFGDWTGRWLYQNSDMESYYMASGSSNDPNERGNNAVGLWIAEPQGFNSGVGGPTIQIDYQRSVITCDERDFSFSPLSTVAQELVVAGGAENLVKERLS